MLDPYSNNGMKGTHTAWVDSLGNKKGIMHLSCG